MKYIDIHCHLDFKDYDTDRDEVLVRMKEGGIGAITIGADLQSSKRAVEIAEVNENIWACIGIHPDSVSESPSLDYKRGVWGELSELVKSPKVVGIGECGLDYFRLKNESEKIKQKALFESQIQFAIKHDKPLMLHIRDAYEDALYILKTYKEAGGPEAAKLRGNVHFFAGGVGQAKRFLDLGFTMSFTGVITFTHDYDEVVKYIPQNSIMSETDAPFVAPVPYRGKRNEPGYVIDVVKKMAEIRGENVDELNNAVVNNAKRTFGIGDII
jgi:TatD DNase family protein